MQCSSADEILRAHSTKAFNNIEYWMSILINVPFQALVAVRTYALFDRSRLIKWIIIILFTVHFLVVISMGVPYSKDITSNTGYAMLPLWVFTSIFLRDNSNKLTDKFEYTLLI